MSKEEMVTLTLELPAEQARAVSTAAAELGITPADFIARAVYELLDKLEVEVAR